MNIENHIITCKGCYNQDWASLCGTQIQEGKMWPFYGCVSEKMVMGRASVSRRDRLIIWLAWSMSVPTRCPLGQSHLGCKDLAEVVVVPSGFQPFGPSADLGCAFPLQQVQSNMPQHGGLLSSQTDLALSYTIESQCNSPNHVDKSDFLRYK